MDRCALFVDAGYVLADGALAVHGTRHRESVSWDYAGLLQLLSSLARERTGLPLLRCYWYEAAVEGRRAPEHEALADLPGLKLRLGRMRPGRREGLDTEIHRDLSTLARNHAISDAVIVSAEEDLAHVVGDIQDLGVRVTLVSIIVDGDWTVSRLLRQESDAIIEIGGAHLGPYVHLIAGAEPAPPRDQQPFGQLGGAPLANGHAAAGRRGPQHALPTGQLSRPPSVYAPQVAMTEPPYAQPRNEHAGLPSAQAAHVQPLQAGQPQPAQAGQPQPGQAEPSPLGPPERRELAAASPPEAAGAQEEPHVQMFAAPTPTPAPEAVAGVQAYPAAQPQAAAAAQAQDAAQAAPGYAQAGQAASATFVPQGPAQQGPVEQSPVQPGLTQQGMATPGEHLGPYVPPQPSAYSGLQAAALPPAGAPASVTLADATAAAHAEGLDFGGSVARDAPALWLEAVLARKPRMPSDLEARLLQGSALPIDLLLHDEVRHALRRGFWDALERARR